MCVLYSKIALAENEEQAHQQGLADVGTCNRNRLLPAIAGDAPMPYCEGGRGDVQLFS